jgi:peptide deformylase
MEILKFPNNHLREKSKNFNLKNEDERIELVKLVKDMQETLYEANGIGLAAPQVGITKKLFIIDLEQKVEKNKDGEVTKVKPGFLMVFINPEIKFKEGEILYEEGCLSVPGVYEEVKRAEKVEVEFYDLSFTKKVIIAEDMLAIAIQHEYDHLEGKLFIDRLPAIKRTMVKNRILKGKNL